jgi:hypothetical protein
VKEEKAKAFISRAGSALAEDEPRENRKPTMIRIPPGLLGRIDSSARRLGISRSAFIVQSAAEKIERLDN